MKFQGIKEVVEIINATKFSEDEPFRIEVYVNRATGRVYAFPSDSDYYEEAADHNPDVLKVGNIVTSITEEQLAFLVKERFREEKAVKKLTPDQTATGGCVYLSFPDDVSVCLYLSAKETQLGLKSVGVEFDYSHAAVCCAEEKELWRRIDMFKDLNNKLLIPLQCENTKGQTSPIKALFGVLYGENEEITFNLYPDQLYVILAALAISIDTDGVHYIPPSEEWNREVTSRIQTLSKNAE